MRRLALIATVVLALCAGATPAAAEPFGLTDFDVFFGDGEGGAVTQAGSHPTEMRVSFGVATEEGAGGGLNVSEPLKDLEVAQIAGFVGNPTAVPPCQAADFLTPRRNREGTDTASCPDSSAVGLVSVESITSEAVNLPLWNAVFNLAPPPGVAAKLGFWTANVPVTIELGVNDSPPYNVLGGPTNVSQVVEVIGSELILWGVPADPRHDELRGICVAGSGPEPVSFGECSAKVAEKPFLTLPRACQGPLATHYKARSWESPGVWVQGSALTHDSSEPPRPQGMTGCERLRFSPRPSARPTTAWAETASGLEIEIEVDDEEITNPEGIAHADIAATRFALPRGMTVNPSAASGLGVCARAQYQAASLEVAGCPPASKLGTMEVETPILEERTLTGSFYLASQDDNPFGTLLAAYLIVRDPELGIFVKLPARIDLTPAGRIVTTVEDIPPFPYSRITVRLRSGPRAPLVTPPTCGPHSTDISLTPSNGGPVLHRASTFAVTSGPGGSPCPAGPPFAPGFQAGTTNNAAGSYSPFTLRLTRNDGEQDLTRFSASLPPGLSGKIAGIPSCPDAAIAQAGAKSGRAELAAPSCPAASRLGAVQAGAGVGDTLTYVPGSIYLAGPYGGTPLSIVSIVPVVAGPFDVGTVVTRVALNLDPNTAQVIIDGAASDPIPHILQGVSLKLRDLRVVSDRPGFTLNPTSCAPARILASAYGSGLDPFTPADDQPVNREDRFQAASCASLGFKPKLRLRLKGATRRAKNPGFRAELLPRGADANLRGAIVNLPPSQFIDNAHIGNPCTRVQFAANDCPNRSILGRARAFTPLLDAPLEGNVYFRSNGGERKLPDLVVALKGQFEFNLVIAVLEAKQGRIRTKVLNAPDVPVSKFVLNMFAGKRSLLQNSEWLCKKKQRGYLNLIGQNGRRAKSKPVVQTACGKKKSKRGRAHSRAR